MMTKTTQPTTHHPRKRLAQARILRGWSQQEVADKIGTTHVNISRWERGITHPYPHFRHKLCVLFGKSQQELDLEPHSDENTLPPSFQQKEPIYDPVIPLRSTIRLVGRDEVSRRLKDRLWTDGLGALTIVKGLPGVGKTALAIELAHDPDIRAHFRDGILWAGLGPTPTSATFLHHWGALLGLSTTDIATLQSQEAWVMAFRTALASRSFLIVIDDIWQLEDVLPLLIGGPNCAHLATTRSPVVAAHVPPRGVLELDELNSEESFALLRMLAPGVDREEQKARELVQAVGGLPLALSLMGNYLRKQAYSGQARRIQTALEQLSHAEVRLHLSEPRKPDQYSLSTPIDTPLSLQSAIAVSDRYLTEQARTALSALAIFPAKPNHFSEAAALAVAQCSVETLDTLTDSGLLESWGGSRYTMHQTIADYAQAHIQENVVSECLIKYALTYVLDHKKEYELLEQESPVILAALEAAYTMGKYDELVSSVCAIAPFLLLRGFYALAELHLQRANAAAKELEDLSGIVITLQHLGELALKQGKYMQSEAYLQKGLVLARQIGDRESICAMLKDIGEGAWRYGEYAQAVAYLQEGLMLARQTEDHQQMSSFLTHLGSVADLQGEYVNAESYLREGLTLAQLSGDREQICALLAGLGTNLTFQGQYAQAKLHCLEGVELARQLRGREQLCRLLNNLGATTGIQGNYAQSEIYLQEGLDLARQIGHSEWICNILSNLGDLATELGSPTQAETYLEEGLDLARRIGNREMISMILTNLAILARQKQDTTQAEACFQEALSLAQQIGSYRSSIGILYEYGSLYLDLQQVEVAEARFRDMLSAHLEESPDWHALAHFGLARVRALQGRISEARELGEASFASLEAIGERNAKNVRFWLDSLNANADQANISKRAE